MVRAAGFELELHAAEVYGQIFAAPVVEDMEDIGPGVSHEG